MYCIFNRNVGLTTFAKKKKFRSNTGHVLCTLAGTWNGNETKVSVRGLSERAC
jgi:hypothetical protein